MKKQLPAFLTGFLAAVLLLSLSLSAFAAITGKTTIEVGPISIMVNGEVFQPTDVNGNPVDVFVYRGTTYAPLRALAEAYGLEVSYDGEAKMAVVKEPGKEQPTAVNQYGETVHYTISDQTVFVNGEKQTMGVVKCNGANYYDINLLLGACGLEKISTQHILELLADKNSADDGEYLVIGDIIYITPKSIADKFDIEVSYNPNEKAITFSTKD